MDCTVVVTRDAEEDEDDGLGEVKIRPDRIHDLPEEVSLPFI